MEKCIEVLLIEDDPLVTRIVLQSFVEKKFKATVINRLYLALEHLKKSNVDIILLDAAVPDCAKATGVQAILESCPNVPILLLVGENENFSAADALRIGAQDFLLKNHFLLGQLEMRLQRVLGHR